jgi:hypothetical protein
MMGADGGGKQVEPREKTVKKNAIIVTVQALLFSIVACTAELSDA